MTKEFYTEDIINIYKYGVSDSCRFSGIICESDFDGYASMKDIADRIAQDMRFDEQCRKNIVNRDRFKKGNKDE